MALQPVDLELLAEDLETIVGSLESLAGDLYRSKDKLSAEYDAFEPHSFEKSNCCSAIEYGHWMFDASWSDYKIATGRILAQIDVRDFNLLAVSEPHREMLYNLYVLLRNLESLSKPEYNLDDVITFAEKVRNPLLLLEGFWESFRPTAENQGEEVANDGSLDDGPDLSRPKFFNWANSAHSIGKRNWQLCCAVWDNDGVSYLDVSVRVWGNESTRESTIRSALSRLNSSMTCLKIPVQWQTVSERIYREK